MGTEYKTNIRCDFAMVPANWPFEKGEIIEFDFLYYFDLRKFSYIDKNYSFEEQLGLLSEMHKIIETEITPVKGKRYNLHIDTAIYFLPQAVTNSVLNTLISIKNKIDRFFSQKKFPSRLHISCVFGKSYIGEISLENEHVFNIIGEVNNHLQQTIFATESQEGEVLFDKITFHHSAAKQIGVEYFQNKIKVLDHDFFYF